jgi:hypothetical protein
LLIICTAICYSPCEDTISHIKNLRKEKAKGLWSSPEKLLSLGISGNSDVDVFLSNHLKITVLTLTFCENGGGLTLSFWCGLEFYRESEFALFALCAFVN